MYVYKQSEPYLWTVGFYDPKGNWCPESDCDRREEAAERVAWLNGSQSKKDENRIKSYDEIVDEIRSSLKSSVPINAIYKIAAVTFAKQYIDLASEIIDPAFDLLPITYDDDYDKWREAVVNIDILNK